MEGEDYKLTMICMIDMHGMVMSRFQWVSPLLKAGVPTMIEQMKGNASSTSRLVCRRLLVGSSYFW